MKVLEDVRAKLHRDLPLCRSHRVVERLFSDARSMLLESKAPLGQKQQMWEQLKLDLSKLLRRPDLINDAHAIIDRILKDSYVPYPAEGPGPNR